MKRDLWTANLTDTSAPAWPCPACHKGTLLLQPKTFVFKETAGSKAAHVHEAWDPDWIAGAFTAWLTCSNSACAQDSVVSGIGGYESRFDPEEGMICEAYYRPKYCWPMPSLIELPKKCPDDVKEELQLAFAAFWLDTGASANHVRVALEKLLDHIGIKRRTKGKKGKYSDLTLHSRILLFQGGDARIGPQLMALKWLGNTGSHTGTVNRDDLLDALEVLECALGEIIDKRSTRVATIAKQLTKKHAPKKCKGAKN